MSQAVREAERRPCRVWGGGEGGVFQMQGQPEGCPRQGPPAAREGAAYTGPWLATPGGVE